MSGVVSQSQGYKRRYPGANTGYRSNQVVRSVRRVYKKRKVPKAFKAVVENALARNEEKKETNLYSLNHPIVPINAAGWTASSICLSPSIAGYNIAQGTGQGQRVGNRIRVKKSWVKGIIHPSAYNASTNPNPAPYQIRMLIFKDKFAPTSQPAAVALDLFQSGSTSIPPQNDLADCILDINRDRYQVYHDEILKMGPAANQGSGTDVAFAQYMNNDFSFNCKFEVDVTKFLPKTIVFNDASLSAMTDSLWMIFLPCLANGGAIGASVNAITMSWTSVLNYTDA